MLGWQDALFSVLPSTLQHWRCLLHRKSLQQEGCSLTTFQDARRIRIRLTPFQPHQALNAAQ